MNNDLLSAEDVRMSSLALVGFAVGLPGFVAVKVLAPGFFARQEMKALMQRSDGPAIRDSAIWLGSMMLLAAGAIYLWPSPWSVPHK